jgi:hypothetical protein
MAVLAGITSVTLGMRALDGIGRRYYFRSGADLVTVDADSGAIVTQATMSSPSPLELQFRP